MKVGCILSETPCIVRTRKIETTFFNSPLSIPLKLIEVSYMGVVTISRQISVTTNDPLHDNIMKKQHFMDIIKRQIH